MSIKSCSGLGASFCSTKSVSPYLQSSQRRRTRLGEQTDDSLRLGNLVRTQVVLCALAVEEAVLAVEQAGLGHSLQRAVNVARALEDARLEHRKLGERRRVRHREFDELERGGVRGERGLVLGEEVERPKVRRGRLDRFCGATSSASSKGSRT